MQLQQDQIVRPLMMVITPKRVRAGLTFRRLTSTIVDVPHR